MSETKVTFLTVKEPKQKMVQIAQTARIYFAKKEPLFFFTSTEEATRFVDQLLWKMPAESFLPHPSELIQIGSEIPPTFSHVFNLSSLALLMPLKQIYEFEDLSSAEKTALFTQRYEAYKAAKFQLIIKSDPF